MLIRILAAAAATVLFAGCASTDMETSSSPATGGGGTSPSASAEPTGPWTKYGLPPFGSERTGVTVHQSPMKVTGRQNLTGHTVKSEEQIIAVLEELLTEHYWQLDSFPNRSQVGALDEYMAPWFRKAHNNSIRKKEWNNVFGEHIDQETRDRIYDLSIDQIKAHAVQSWNLGERKSAEPGAHFKVSWRSTFTMVNGGKAHRYRYTTRMDVGLADVTGADKPVLVYWKWKRLPAQKTPLKRV